MNETACFWFYRNRNHCTFTVTEVYFMSSDIVFLLISIVDFIYYKKVFYRSQLSQEKIM